MSRIDCTRANCPTWLVACLALSGCGARDNLDGWRTQEASSNLGSGGSLGGALVSSGGAPAMGGTQQGGTGPRLTTSVGGVALTKATGGQATGGNATGGVSTGGRATGGSATGGVSTGGRATGGNATGGVSTGGFLTSGGTMPGGAAGHYAAGSAGSPGSVAGAGGSPAGFGGSSAIANGGATAGNGATLASAGSAGAAGSNNSAVWYVDAQHGSDIWPGTQEQPFRSIGYAATRAKTADNIWLFDGVYDQTTEAQLVTLTESDCGTASGIIFAPNVSLRAVNSGAVRIVSSGYHGLCFDGGLAEGLMLEAGNPNRPVVEAKHGTLNLRETAFGNCGAMCLQTAGNAVVKMQNGRLSEYSFAPNLRFAQLGEQSSLTIEGGRLTVTEVGLAVSDTARLLLRDLTLSSVVADDNSNNGVWLSSGAGSVVVEQGSVITGFGTAIFGISPAGSVSLQNATLCGNTVGVFAEQCAGLTLSILNSQFIDCFFDGVSAWGSLFATIRGTSFLNGGTTAIFLDGTNSATLDGIKISGGQVGLNLGWYSRWNNIDGANAITVRNVEVSGMRYSGVFVGGTLTDSFDFGTASSPGNNRFFGNNTDAHGDGSNFVIYAPSGSIVHAIGNTWDPNADGADATGHYSLPTPGAVWDLTGIQGKNFSFRYDNSAVRVVENPP